MKPEAHGTHHLQAVKPGCRDPAAVAGLGCLRGLIAQRTSETHGPRIKRSGAPSTPTTIATATSAVHDVYMITWHKEQYLGGSPLKPSVYSAGGVDSAGILIATSYVKHDTRG